MKVTLIWYIAGIAAAISVGWLAARLNLAGIAPLGLLSLAVGITLGAILSSLAALTHVTCRKRLIAGTILLALLTVLAEHAWLYRDFRRQWHEARANSPEVALFRPETPWSPAEYFAREVTPGRAALWTVDSVLVTGTAVATMLLLQRKFTTTRVASDAAKSLTPGP